MSRPCSHCNQIDSGDVAFYQITCPEGGEAPASRNHFYPGLIPANV
jgi:hypothetical protein